MRSKGKLAKEASLWVCHAGSFFGFKKFKGHKSLCIRHVRSDFAKEGSEAEKAQGVWVVEEADRPKAGPRLPLVSCRHSEKPQTLFGLVSSAGKWASGRVWGKR